MDPAADPIAAFADWTRRWTGASDAERGRMIGEGLRLAAERRSALASLIESDPEAALRAALPVATARALPAPFAGYLEERVSGLARFEVLGQTALPGAPPIAVRRFATLGNRRFEVHAYGRRLAQPTRDAVAVHGIALSGHLALAESPARRVEPAEEAPAPRDARCPTGEVLDLGGVYRRVCSEAEAAVLERSSLDDALVAHSAWTTGQKTVLFIPVDFTDHPGAPLSASSATTLIDSTVSSFYVEASYNKTSLVSTVVPLQTMPQTAAWYSANDTSGYQLLADARAAAKAAGFDYTTFDRDITAFARVIPAYAAWAGQGFVGSRGIWLNGYFDLRTTGHEMGHNYGVWHANYWAANGDSIFGPGSNNEYGNAWDVMGSSGGSMAHHFNAWFKNTFDWIPATEVQKVTVSGTYRIQALESPVPSGLHAISVARSSSDTFWFELRQKFTSNAWLMSGAAVNMQSYRMSSGSELLDTTPGSASGKNDHPLTIGRTLADDIGNVYVTPVGKGGTTPESLDLVVNLGPFPGNRNPTVTLTPSATSVGTGVSVSFTATASDPDGDPLAYGWNFGDDGFGPNAPTATKSWGAAGDYPVVLTVSDMKGGVALASVLVTVGTPATFTVSGQATAGGKPLAGVRVTDGTVSTFTDSNGNYALGNVAAGAKTISAVKFGWTFAPSGFTNPVTVGPSATGVSFTGTEQTFSISGTVTDAGLAVPGVTVTAGGYTATTNATGDYTLTGVPNGQYTLAATKAGYTFNPCCWSGPVEVMGANLTAKNFQTVAYWLSGLITGVPSAPTVSDGVHSTVAYAQGAGTFGYSLQVPAGTWNLAATLAGYTIIPSNFTNPVTVAGASIPNLNFTGGGGSSWMITGSITEAGARVPGVSVTDGTRSAVTDGLGRYALIGVPAGSYTVTPSKAGLSFAPANRSVTVTSADVTGQDFAANAPPTVATPAAAAPNPVTGTTATLSVLGADDAGEAALRYTWAATVAPGTVGFSANGSNAAKSSLVTFGAPGSYTFSVKIEDGQGEFVTSTATVVVQSTLTTILVTPGAAAVQAGNTQLFIAAAEDQFGTALAPQPVITWSVSGGGTIDSAGLFTATTSGGPYVVTAQSGAVTGTATVSVAADQPPTLAQAVAATPNPVTGTTTSLTVLGADDGGEPALVYGWSATGPAPVSFSRSGSNAAKSSTATFSAPGTYVITGTVTDVFGLTAAGQVTVDVVATATSVGVDPATASVRVGATQLFSATVLDQFAAPVAPQPAATWTVGGGGTIDATGLFHAVTAGGPFPVTAQAGGLSGTAQVTVAANQPPAIAVGPTASPNPVTGTATTLAVLGTDDAGEANLVYTWSVSGPSPVSFGENGTNAAKTSVATFTTPGSFVFTVKVADQDGASVEGTVAVTVLATPSSLEVTPSDVTVHLGDTQAFAAVAKDQFGAPLATQPGLTWSASGGGTIDAAGLFTGTTEGGPFTVEADGGGLAGRASVTVTTLTAPTIVDVKVNPNPVDAGTAAVSATATDALGEAGLSYTWTAVGPAKVAFDRNGTNAAKNAVATFTATGSYTVSVLVVNAAKLTAAKTVPVEVRSVKAAKSQVHGKGGCGCGGEAGAGALALFGLAALTRPGGRRRAPGSR